MCKDYNYFCTNCNDHVYTITEPCDKIPANSTPTSCPDYGQETVDARDLYCSKCSRLLNNVSIFGRSGDFIEPMSNNANNKRWYNIQHEPDRASKAPRLRRMAGRCFFTTDPRTGERVPDWVGSTYEQAYRYCPSTEPETEPDTGLARSPTVQVVQSESPQPDLHSDFLSCRTFSSKLSIASRKLRRKQSFENLFQKIGEHRDDKPRQPSPTMSSALPAELGRKKSGQDSSGRHSSPSHEDQHRREHRRAMHDATSTRSRDKGSRHHSSSHNEEQPHREHRRSATDALSGKSKDRDSRHFSTSHGKNQPRRERRDPLTDASSGESKNDRDKESDHKSSSRHRSHRSHKPHKSHRSSQHGDGQPYQSIRTKSGKSEPMMSGALPPEPEPKLEPKFEPEPEHKDHN